MDDEPVFDGRDNNLYFPKEVGARYPEVHIHVCFTILFISLFAILMISNYQTPVPYQLRLKRSFSSFSVMTPAKRERLTILSKNYMISKI